MKSMHMNSKASWKSEVAEKSVGFVVHSLDRNKWCMIRQ